MCGFFFRYSANKTDRHDIIEIFLKVALNTITLFPIREIQQKNCYFGSLEQNSYINYTNYNFFYNKCIHKYFALEL
jgi:hypothetical protein